MQSFAVPRSKRTDTRSHGSTTRAGKLTPVGCVAVRPSESGTLHQEISVELEPIAGRLVTTPVVEVHSVFVPALAAYHVNRNFAENTDNVELFRNKLLDGSSLFGLSNPVPVDDVMGLEPMRIDGEEKISTMPRRSHVAAVNFLRKRRYMYAQEIPYTHASVTPALLSNTALDIFNAVLTPEDRINGAVSLRGEVPVKGLALLGSPVFRENGLYNYDDHVESSANGSIDSVGNDPATGEPGWIISNSYNTSGGGTVHPSHEAMQLFVSAKDLDDGAGESFAPHVFADMSAAGTTLSLTDFMKSERQDELMRLFSAMLKSNPELGEKIIANAIHGLDVPMDGIPFEMFSRTVALGSSIRRGTDGPSLDVEQTSTSAVVPFSVVVPKSEFGGVIITFLSVKPEESIQKQPDPIFSKDWYVDNYAADEMAYEPVPVSFRELSSEVPQSLENDVAFYVGNNHLQSNYARMDWSNDVDPATVEHRNSVWRFPIPLSVTPENILYPDVVDITPFALNSATDPVASYWFKSQATFQSPTHLGPTPLEEISVVDDEDLFEENNDA